MSKNTSNIGRARSAVVATLLTAGVLAACGGSDAADTSESGADGSAVSVAESESTALPRGFATVGTDDAAALLADPPDGLVVLDVRTAEEFAAGHVEGAVMADFYSDDFAQQLAALDPDVPYLVYCRSGNRSGQTLSIMEELGFASAVDIGGGVVAWEQAGLPLVR